MPQTAMGPAREVAERIRRQVEQLGFRSNGRAIRVSVSLGLAHADAGMAEVGMLFKRADEALYAAKRSGRNCVMAVADVGIQPHADAGASIAVGAARRNGSAIRTGRPTRARSLAPLTPRCKSDYSGN